MAASLRRVSAQIDRLASHLHKSREADLPDVRTMGTEALEAELLAICEAHAGRPIETFASPEEFVSAMRATRARLNVIDYDGTHARYDELAIECLKKHLTSGRA